MDFSIGDLFYLTKCFLNFWFTILFYSKLSSDPEDVLTKI